MTVDFISLQKSLHDFCDTLETERKETPELRQIIEHIARFGQHCYEWTQLRTLMAWYFDHSINPNSYSGSSSSSSSSFAPQDSFESAQQRIHHALENLDGAPFTLQRICEILCDPKKHYNHLHKVLFSIEKLLAVCSTLPPLDPSELQSMTSGLLSSPSSSSSNNEINEHNASNSLSDSVHSTDSDSDNFMDVDDDFSTLTENPEIPPNTTLAAQNQDSKQHEPVSSTATFSASGAQDGASSPQKIDNQKDSPTVVAQKKQDDEKPSTATADTTFSTTVVVGTSDNSASGSSKAEQKSSEQQQNHGSREHQ